jgi:hypothetical protein
VADFSLLRQYVSEYLNDRFADQSCHADDRSSITVCTVRTEVSQVAMYSQALPCYLQRAET